MCALSGELVIDLSAIRQNYKSLDDLSGRLCKTAPSVKANAYGLGAGHVVPALYQAGARSFFVATLDEAIEIRGMLSDVDIHILNGFFDKAHDVYRQYNLIPVLNSLYEIELYQAQAKRLEIRLPALLHFDTGMNRLGIPEEEAKILFNDLSLLEGINVRYVMSHFVSSEEAKNPSNAAQFKKFKSVMSHFPDTKFSMCNSGGVFLSPDYHLDLTRPGIALYGGKPTANNSGNPMEPVVSLNVPVLQIHSVKQGENAGYNGTYCFHKDGYVAVMSIGYADGLFRYIGNKGALYWKGKKMPIRGRVSMDLVICDLDGIAQEDYPKQGDMVEVIGPNQSVDDLAVSVSTISYEIITALGRRYKRNHL